MAAESKHKVAPSRCAGNKEEVLLSVASKDRAKTNIKSSPTHSPGVP